MKKLTTLLFGVLLFASWQAMATTGIGKAEAEKIAETATESSEVLDSHLAKDTETGKLVWKVEVEKASEVDTVEIDRKSGKVLEVKKVFDN